MARSVMYLFDKGLIPKKKLHSKLTLECKKWKVLKKLKKPLYAHLGLTWKEYISWVVNPRNLVKIVKAREIARETSREENRKIFLTKTQ
jgi:hypothetical protein